MINRRRKRHQVCLRLRVSNRRPQLINNHLAVIEWTKAVTVVCNQRLSVEEINNYMSK